MVASTVVIFFAFDALLHIFPDLIGRVSAETFQEFLYQPKVIFIMIAGGVGGLLAFLIGTILTAIYWSEGTLAQHRRQLGLFWGYAIVGLVIGLILMQSGSMEDGIGFLKAHPTFNVVSDLVLGGSFAGYALRFLMNPRKTLSVLQSNRQ